MSDTSTDNMEYDNALQLTLYPPAFTPPPQRSSTITQFSIAPWFKARTGVDFTDEELAIFLLRGMDQFNYRDSMGQMSPERYKTICEFIRIHGERVYLYHLGRLSSEEIVELNRKQLELQRFMALNYWPIHQYRRVGI